MTDTPALTDAHALDHFIAANSPGWLKRVHRQQIIDLLGDDKRAALAAHARCALLKGEIDANAERLLLALTSDRPTPDISIGHLQLLGFDVHGALLLAASASHPKLAGQVLLYLPNDPDRALRPCRSLAALNDELASRLRDPGYAGFLGRQLQRDDRPSFLGKLQSSLGAALPQLQVQSPATGANPFEWLARRQIARIRADAAQLLVPTAAIDQALHRQRMEAFKSVGANVGNLLASFIPGVGELMLVGLIKERFIEALLADAGELHADQRLPLELQEKARQAMREVRVVQALEGLYLDSRCGNDTVRMVFSLLRSLPQWPRGLSFELRDNSLDGPVIERLLPLTEAYEVRVLVGRDLHFRLRNRRRPCTNRHGFSPNRHWTPAHRARCAGRQELASTSVR